MKGLEKPARRTVLKGLAGALVAPALPLSGLARAEAAYPNRPINFICPWPAGSISDTTMRVLAKLASDELGQPIVVENRAGASGMLGVKSMTNAKPDGYTIGQIPLSVTRFSQLGTVKIDALKDITYIARVAGLAFGIVVRADSPFKDMKSLMAYAKANPGKLTYGSPGVGNQTHIGMESLLKSSGVSMTHVPFKGGNEATQALLGGHVDLVADSSTWAPFVESGQLRLLSTWGEQRLKRFPNVPTLKEQGFNLVMNAPGGIGAPAGLPVAVETRLREAFRKAALNPAFQAALDKYDMIVMYQDAKDYRAFIEQSYREETALIARLNLRELLK